MVSGIIEKYNSWILIVSGLIEKNLIVDDSTDFELDSKIILEFELEKTQSYKTHTMRIIPNYKHMLKLYSSIMYSIWYKVLT